MLKTILIYKCWLINHFDLVNDIHMVLKMLVYHTGIVITIIPPPADYVRKCIGKNFIYEGLTFTCNDITYRHKIYKFKYFYIANYDYCVYFCYDTRKHGKVKIKLTSDQYNFIIMNGKPESDWRSDHFIYPHPNSTIKLWCNI